MISAEHSLKVATMPQNSPPLVSDIPRDQEDVASVGGLEIINENYVGRPAQPMDMEDLEAALNCERSRQPSFRSLRSSQSSFCSFKSVGRFSRWGSFKSCKSAVSLTSFMSAKWDLTDQPAGREVAMVAPLPRAPRIDPKLEKKRVKGNDCAFLLIFFTGILLAMMSAAFALCLWMWF